MITVELPHEEAEELLKAASAQFIVKSRLLRECDDKHERQVLEKTLGLLDNALDQLSQKLGG